MVTRGWKALKRGWEAFSATRAAWRRISPENVSLTKWGTKWGKFR
jgi:hypothetical protein